MAHRTTPDDTKGMPGGIPYIIGNELAERFSFYGMKGILVVYMTKHLLDSSGQPAYMSETDAKAIYHLFTASAYFFPLIGALISDILWGKYKTILILSLAYCLGHACLAMGDSGIGAALLEPKTWLFIGMGLIAVGAGGIKPCVSAHVGDQFGPRNQSLIEKVFFWFYFSINVGSLTSMLLTPWLLAKFGPWLAFGLPGILMGLATLCFWMGRNKFVHIPPEGIEKFAMETAGPDGRQALRQLAPLFLLVIPMFWAIFDQTGSEWVIQARQLDRTFLGFDWLESQVQAVNPALVLLLIPVFAFAIYPAINKVWPLTPLRKIGIGLFVTVLAFAITGWLETRIEKTAPQAVAKIAAIEPEHIDTDDTLGEVIGELRRPRWVMEGIAGRFIAQDPSLVAQHMALDEAVAVLTASDMSVAEVDAAVIAAMGQVEAETVASGEHSAIVQVLVTQHPEIYGAAVSSGDLVRRLRDLGTEDAVILARFAAADPDGVGVEGEVGAGDGDGAVRKAVDEASETVSEPFWSEERIQGELVGTMPSIGWQFLAYLVLTAAEVMVSITALEFAYTQAPKKMKSFVMGVYFLGVSFGNFFTSGVNFLMGLPFLQDENGASRLDGANYYWFFCGLMLLVAVVHIFLARSYKGRTYIQGDGDGNAEAEAGAVGNS